jgi:hypothetical protein
MTRKLVMFALLGTMATVGSVVIANDGRDGPCYAIRSLKVGMDTASVERVLGPTTMVSNLLEEKTGEHVVGHVLTYRWAAPRIGVWTDTADIYVKDDLVTQVALKRALLVSVWGRSVIAFADIKAGARHGSADTDGDWFSRFAFRCSHHSSTER